MKPRFRPLRTKKAGLPPGSLVYTGMPRMQKTGCYVVSYDAAHVECRPAAKIEEALALRGKAAFLWINIDGIHETELVRKCGDALGIHPLVQEDILNPEQRPKVEQYDNFLYLVLRSLSVSGVDPIESEQISLVLGNDFLVSFQEKPGDAFAPILKRFAHDGARVRSAGMDYLLYTLIDSIVDGYFTVLERMGERIESLLGQIVENPDPQGLRTLNQLKHDGLFLRRAIWPLREVIAMLERGEIRFIQAATQPFLRDVYSHIIEVIDTVETFREMLSNLLDIYLSSVSNKMNTVMKVLTVITTIFMPLSFIAGVYGMNFEHMPELRSPYGYPAVLIVMVLVAAIMLLFFRKKRWL